MKCCTVPDFCIVRSTELTVGVWYSIPGDAYGLRNVVAKSRKRLKITPRLIKVMIKIHVFYKVIHQEYQQIQSAIFWSHLYKFSGFFHVDHRYKYQTEVWKKLQFLTNFCSLDNDDPISFFMILLRTQIFVYKDFSSTTRATKGMTLLLKGSHCN